MTFRFYLGTHMLAWMRDERFTDVPLFVSRRRFEKRRTLPRSVTDWALDSGGFTELSMHGAWTLSPVDYVAFVRRAQDEIGRMQWAAPQDWMCEPVITAKTGLTVADHLALTVQNFLDLRALAPDLPIAPVIQGWAFDDYRRCVDAYDRAGIDLRAYPVVGVGTICRRQGTVEAERILRHLASLGISLHAFGAKIVGLHRFYDALASSDSLAWSYAARRDAPLPGCSHRSCANCPVYAIAWCRRLRSAMARPHQLALTGTA